MALDQYRLQPLPPRKKPIWKILAFGMVEILLTSMFIFLTMNQRIICEGTGGRWAVWPEIREIVEKQNPTSRISWDDYWTEEKIEAMGMCIR